MRPEGFWLRSESNDLGATLVISLSDIAYKRRTKALRKEKTQG